MPRSGPRKRHYENGSPAFWNSRTNHTIRNALAILEYPHLEFTAIDLGHGIRVPVGSVYAQLRVLERLGLVKKVGKIAVRAGLQWRVVYRDSWRKLARLERMK